MKKKLPILIELSAHLKAIESIVREAASAIQDIEEELPQGTGTDAEEYAKIRIPVFYNWKGKSND